jgi:hypothetical protein
MTSLYLDQPLLPLAVALPRILEKIEADLGDETAGPAETWRLHQREQLIRSLLASEPDTYPAVTETGSKLGKNENAPLPAPCDKIRV